MVAGFCFLVILEVFQSYRKLSHQSRVSFASHSFDIHCTYSPTFTFDECILVISDLFALLSERHATRDRIRRARVKITR